MLIHRRKSIGKRKVAKTTTDDRGSPVDQQQIDTRIPLGSALTNVIERLADQIDADIKAIKPARRP